MNHSLTEAFDLDYEQLFKLYKERHADVSNICYASIAYNSPLNDIKFIHNYITDCLTKYEIILENNNLLKNRNDIKQFVDISSSLSSCTIKFYVNNDFNLSETIIYFIKQFLSLIFNNIDFLVVNIASADDDLTGINSTKFKLLIEPIAKNKIYLIEDNDENIQKLAEFLFAITSYLENSVNNVSSTLIKSKYWVKNYTDFPVIIDDGVHINIFEKYPELYRMVFEIRDNLLKEDFNFVNNDIDQIIKLDNHENYISDENENENEIDEEFINDEIKNMFKLNEAKELSLCIENLYSKMFPEQFKKIKLEDIHFNQTDLPLYIKINEYDDDEALNKSLTEIFNAVYNEKENIILSDHMPIILNDEDVPKTNNQFKKFNYNYHDKNVDANIEDFVRYISDSIKDFSVVTKKIIDKNVVDNLVNSYNKFPIKINSINTNENNIFINCFITGSDYQFTFSRKDGIIDTIKITDNIKYKEVE